MRKIDVLSVVGMMVALGATTLASDLLPNATDLFFDNHFSVVPKPLPKKEEKERVVDEDDTHSHHKTYETLRKRTPSKEADKDKDKARD